MVVGHHPATAPRSAPPRQPKCRFSPLAAGSHGARPAAARPEREARSWPLRPPLLALAAVAGAAGLAGGGIKGTEPLGGAAGAQAAAQPPPWRTTALRQSAPRCHWIWIYSQREWERYMSVT